MFFFILHGRQQLDQRRPGLRVRHAQGQDGRDEGDVDDGLKKLMEKRE
jgi:hypothetical protein